MKKLMSQEILSVKNSLIKKKLQKLKEKQVNHFNNESKKVFNDEFKGFEFEVGDKKYRYNVNDKQKVLDKQANILNVLDKYISKDNMLQDAQGYHKALFVADNADAIANHFYEQGKADAIKQLDAESKNINMAVITPTGGTNLNAVPAPVKQTLATNYLSFTGGANDWSQQYLPDLYEAEVERYGDRSIASFLRMVGAEMPMTSDQVIWSEQGRLHLTYTGALNTTSGVVTIAASGTHAIRVGQTVKLKGSTSGIIANAYVSAVNAGATTLDLKRYDKALFSTAPAFTNSETVTIFVIGSEFAKATTGMTGAVTPSFKSFTNKPIILKDKYEISGSDASQVGWVEVTGENGQSGYLWYLKAEGDTRTRFEDYLEMSMVEGELAANGSGAAGVTAIGGTEGLFAAIEDRGHVTAGVDGNTATEDLADFDEILKKLDTQGAIEENMLFVNRDVALNIDDMLAAQNSYGSGGTSYGVFSNSEDMALNLGFSGFRRGSYDFYKTDWKYLNDITTGGAFASIRGVVVPAGTSTVYDQTLGKNIKRPFLHVRYRASEADDRRMKSWTTGSVGGATTSDLDAMEVHYLSERCLVVQGANNFMLLN